MTNYRALRIFIRQLHDFNISDYTTDVLIYDNRFDAHPSHMNRPLVKVRLNRFYPTASS